jgi:16S rRNA (uracil1498-N3)-methyltransferase
MRQFLAEANLEEDGTLTVSGKKYHYLREVVRVSLGDMIDVRTADGLLLKMTVAFVDGKKKCVVLQNTAQSQDDFSLQNKSVDLWLFQFIAKPVKMELIVRQAVECGVKHFVPIKGEYSQKGSLLSAQSAASLMGNGSRWEKIIIEARQQSGSASDMQVHPCVSVEEACDLWNKVTSQLNKNESRALALYERNENTIALHKALKNADEIKCVAIAVGCEGGISPLEIDVLQKNGFKTIHFATNILRCETAALYGTAALQNAILEKDEWENRE